MKQSPGPKAASIQGDTYNLLFCTQHALCCSAPDAGANAAYLAGTGTHKAKPQHHLQEFLP